MPNKTNQTDQTETPVLIHVPLPGSLHRTLKARAAQEARTIPAVVTDLLTAMLDPQPPKNRPTSFNADASSVDTKDRAAYGRPNSSENTDDHGSSGPNADRAERP